MIIRRYLFRDIYSNLLGITLVLILIIFTDQLARYLKDVAKGKITIGIMLKIMSLQIPLMLGYLIPLGVYLAILLALGRWYLNNEATILSACGVSFAQLLTMVMGFATLVAIVVGALMLWFVPLVQAYQTKVMLQSLAQTTVAKVMPKRFKEIGNNTIFYAKAISHHKNTLYGVMLARKKNANQHGQPASWDITVADYANIQTPHQQAGKFLTFHHGYRYVGVPGKNDYQVVKFAQYGIRLNNSPIYLNRFPFDASTKQLWQQRNKSLDANAMLQWRIAMPISVLIFALMAVPLAKVNPRQGKYAQLIPALLIYVAYADLLFLTRSWIRHGTLNPNIGFWWLHGAAFCIALGLIVYRVGWRRVLFK